MPQFLAMKNINKRFGGVQALDNVGFELEKGEVHCLVGQNGSGKSTLIKMIAGVLKPDAGAEVQIQGISVPAISPKVAFENGIYVIYQDLSLFANLTVAENIAFHSHFDKGGALINWKHIYEIAQAALNRIQVNLDLNELVSNLSIADRQLVAIARALAADAKLIIMDEPTSSLTRKEVNILFGIIRDLQAKGITILFVSHKLDEIIEIAQRITILRDGAHMGTLENKEIDNLTLSYLISGQQIQYKSAYRQPDDSPVVLEVNQLSAKNQFEDICFTLQKGEILGIIGLLGSGRTELSLSLFGMNAADRGEIKINGKIVKLLSNKDAIANGVAYVPEDRLLQGLILDQSVESNIAVSVLEKIKDKIGLLDLKKRRRITNDWIDSLQIKSATPDIHASALSGGNQQKIVISKWLATNPQILILDEPTNGIDVSAKSAIYDIIRSLAQQGMGIIMISDEVPEIYYNCSRAMIMHKGRIVKRLYTSEISEGEFYDNVLHAQ